MASATDPDERTLVDQALDLFVYAPVGLALEARELIPKLAERGRGQVALARFLGQMAVRKGQQEAERFVGRTRAGQGSGDPAAAESAGAPGSATSFPITGYDDLRASDILPLLEGLDPEQLDEVATYETANRSRRTVLGKITQLRG